MKLRFLGGTREVGRSALFLDDSLLIDYGMKSGNPPGFPVGNFGPEAAVISHGHLDHVGTVPSLLSGNARPPIHWTPPTRDLGLLLARDTLKLRGGRYDCPFTETEISRLTQVSEVHDYRERFDAAGHEITLFDAGHIPGSAHVLVDDSEVQRTSGNRTQSGNGDTRLLYTGDFHTADQRIVSASTARPDADVVVCESTYSDVEHEARAVVEKRFAESLERTLWEGGTVVVPAFAIGRTQEVMAICERHDIECYVDGMGKRVTELLTHSPGFVSEDALKRAKSHARFVTNPGQRERIADQSTVIITTSGMLSGGPAMTYVPLIRDHPVNKIAFVGYQVAGTPGRELIETGSAEIDGRMLPVSAQVEQYELSAHADHDGLREFLDSYRDSQIFVVHGDRCADFAAELRSKGFDASAPELGDEVEV